MMGDAYRFTIQGRLIQKLYIIDPRVDSDVRQALQHRNSAKLCQGRKHGRHADYSGIGD
jgi:hypothetical protein